MPPPVVVGKRTSKLDGVDLEPLQYVLIDHGELLDDIVYADGPFRKAEVIAQSGVRYGIDAGGTVP